MSSGYDGNRSNDECDNDMDKQDLKECDDEDIGIFANTPATHGLMDKYYDLWMQIPGDRWNYDSSSQFLPNHLDSKERGVALQEIIAIPEHFYSHSLLPVITPLNAKQFVDVMVKTGFQITLWSWFSGSSSLT